MKVGLCCCYSNHNYGSMLQSLANVQAVRQLGHKCEIVRYVKRHSLAQKLRQSPRIFNSGNVVKLKNLARDRFLSQSHPEITRQRRIRDEKFDTYCRNTFTEVSDAYVGWDSLRAGSVRYDAVMVGSDQLWLPAGLPTNFYNLQFAAPGVRRISYATSFGVASIPWYQRSRTADYLERIDYLSVREDAGAAICHHVGGVKARVVVDPTLLLTDEEWQGLIPVSSISRGPYIFCYFLGRNQLCRKEARLLSIETGLPIVVLRHLDEIIPTDESFGDKAPYDVDPAGFVNLIRNAEYVLTDSFHGTVFSTICHKRYATFYRFQQKERQSRNSRIESLFSHLDLTGRLVTQEGQALRVLTSKVDFNAVDERLEAWRAGSWGFLRRALEQ